MPKRDTRFSAIACLFLAATCLFVLSRQPVSAQPPFAPDFWVYLPYVSTPSVFDLVQEVIGFGEQTTGGLDGELYHVTNLNDTGPGSLREGAESSDPLWIVFDLSGEIQLQSRIDVAANKTIDGRGQRITLKGHGLRISGQENVIVSHLIFEDGLVTSDDAISVRDDSRNVWLNHLTMRRFGDGLIDITGESTNVTVSWSRFEDHIKVMLIGSSDDEPQDAAIKVTVHHNYFKQTSERNPRLRYGQVHAFNNYLDQWTGYGMASTADGQLFSENNLLQEWNGRDKGIISGIEAGPKGNVRSEGDLRIGNVRIDIRNPELVFTPPYNYQAQAANETLRQQIISGAGWQLVQP